MEANGKMEHNGKKIGALEHKLMFSNSTSFTVNGSKWKIEKRGEYEYLVILIEGTFQYGDQRMYAKNATLENFSEISDLWDYLQRQGLVYRD